MPNDKAKDNIFQVFENMGILYVVLLFGKAWARFKNLLS
jgi:hypothetical protein